MADWGETLARARQARGMTLQEVAGATKIGVRLLAAIEASDERRLPGGLFNRSFVRTYARYLGLDDNAVVAQYLAASGETPPAAIAPPPEPVAAAPAWLSAQSLMAAAIVVVVLGAGYGAYRLSRPNRRAPAAAAASGRRAAARPVVAGTAAKRAAPAGAVSLRLQVSEPAWVKLQANHRVILETTLEPGPEHSYQLTPPLRLVTGNAAATHVTLNGAPQPSLGGEGAIAYWLYPPRAAPRALPAKGAAPAPAAGGAGPRTSAG